jgi:hypothetical protein
MPSKQDLLSLVNSITTHARQREAQRRELARSPMLPRENAAAALGLFDAETSTQRQPAVAKFRATLAAYRAEYVRPLPDFRPTSAPLASWLSAIASVAPSYTPAVLSQQLETAAARNDLSTIALLLPLAESKSSYSEPFKADGGLSNAIFTARETLNSTPEARASAEAAAWCADAEQQFSALEGVLDGRSPASSPIEGLDLYEQNGVLSTLIPGNTP